MRQDRQRIHLLRVSAVRRLVGKQTAARIPIGLQDGRFQVCAGAYIVCKGRLPEASFEISGPVDKREGVADRARRQKNRPDPPEARRWAIALTQSTKFHQGICAESRSGF